MSKLKTQKADADQAFEILSCVQYARFDSKNPKVLIEQIWNELKCQIDNFQIQHYNCILHLTRNQDNLKLAEEIFNEIEKNGIKPDA